MQRIGTKALLWVLTLGMCAIIFVFSAQDGDASMSTSGRFAMPIARLIASLQGGLSEKAFGELLDNVQVVVRKTAHFTEYAILGCLIFLLLTSYDIRRSLSLAEILTALYAAGDEIHQMLGGSRTGMWQDVVLDACGGLCGILICRAVLRFREKRRISKTESDKNAERQST